MCRSLIRSNERCWRASEVPNVDVGACERMREGFGAMAEVAASELLMRREVRLLNFDVRNVPKLENERK